MNRLIVCCFLILLTAGLTAQTVTIQGYVFESGNRGFLNLVEVTAFDQATNAQVQQVYSDKDGVFMLELPVGGSYKITATKDLFVEREDIISTADAETGGKIFVKMEMSRKPGYLFDVTMAEKRTDPDQPVDAIQGAWIEVYNNTKKEQILNLKDYPHHNFKVTFEDGNHYTVLIRQNGYFNKRMDAFVNVEGCILCFEGVGTVRPGVSDVLTEGHSMGTLLANVELEKIVIDEPIRLEKIYYNKNSSKIRDDAALELDKVILMLRNNPSLIVELSSHTDARGKDAYNQKLSQARAEAAVDYLVAFGNIDATRLIAKGYGESKLINSCGNGVDCPEKKHERNRRTELKIVGVAPANSFAQKTLAEILEEEEFYKLMKEVADSGEQIRIAEGEELPDEIKEQMKQDSVVMDAPSSIQPDAPVADQPKPQNKPLIISTQSGKPASGSASPQATAKMDEPDIPAAESQRKITTSEPVLSPGQVEDQTEKPIGAGIDPEPYSDGMADRSEEGFITQEMEVKTNTYARKPTALESDYSGYSVEFYRSNYELPSSHEIFSKHGDIIVDQLSDGSYAYMLGSFQEWRDANSFLNKILLRSYPTAEVVHYKRGKRLRS